MIKISCRMFSQRSMYVVGENSIWYIMEILCAYGMWSRFWKESKFDMIEVCKVCFFKRIEFREKLEFLF